MKKNKRISLKYLGKLYSNGSNSNTDIFNIYSKSALFNYENAKELNKILYKFRKSSKVFCDIHTKKKNFFMVDWFMDDIGNVININLIKHPDIGEGILYTPSYSVFNSTGTWLKPSFVKHFIKFEKPYQTIKIDDNKLCFGFFDNNDLDFINMKKFFKKKNKKNIKEFQTYIKEKYDNIVKNRFGPFDHEKNGGTCVFECKVPNGRHKFYSLTLKTALGDASVEENPWLGNLILYKK